MDPSAYFFRHVLSCSNANTLISITITGHLLSNWSVKYFTCLKSKSPALIWIYMWINNPKTSIHWFLKKERSRQGYPMTIYSQCYTQNTQIGHVVHFLKILPVTSHCLGTALEICGTSLFPPLTPTPGLLSVIWMCRSHSNSGCPLCSFQLP